MNDDYITRGELLLRLDWEDAWEEEMESMNAGKSGRPYRYLESLIEFDESRQMVFWLPFRQLEGLLRALACLIGFQVSYYTTLCHSKCQCKTHLETVDLSGSGWTLAIYSNRNQSERSQRLDAGEMPCELRLDQNAYVR